MKKFLMMAVAAAAVSAPAMADTYKGKTYGQDAIGVFAINASVQGFCKFGTQNTGGTALNGSATAGAPGSVAEADGTFTLNIQDLSDDTVRAANARYDIAYAVCNSPFSMTLASHNGGLKTSATTSDPEFTSLVPYDVDFEFDSLSTSASPMTIGTHTVGSSHEARAGSAKIKVSVSASDDLLIRGTYSDRLTAALVPNVGG